MGVYGGERGDEAGEGREEVRGWVLGLRVCRLWAGVLLL